VGLVVVLAGCDLSYLEEEENTGTATTSANDNPTTGTDTGTSTEPLDLDPQLVGEWYTSSYVADFLYSSKDLTTYGGGGSGQGYCFRPDGTYLFYYVTTGYGPTTMAGWILQKGSWLSEDFHLLLFDRVESYTSTSTPQSSYDWTDAGWSEFSYQWQSADQVSIENALGDYTTFTRGSRLSECSAVS